MNKYIPFLLLAACVDGPKNTIPPEQAATAFCKALEIKYVGAPVCAGVDTDNDGYVTCTVNLGDGNMWSLQCAAVTTTGPDGCTPMTYAVGCKQTVPKPVVVRQ